MSTTPATNPTIKRALVSVTDKEGIVDFCQTLTNDFGIEVISTGGTAALLSNAGIPVTPIEEVTGLPEMMDGRVKTLHPKVHGALLARRDNPQHVEEAKIHDIGTIDLVVANLYAFEAAVARGDLSEEDIIENIDIGGPSMLRSAAKNFASVTVITCPDSYNDFIIELRENAGSTTLKTRKGLAQKVFGLTAHYDAAIAHYLSGDLNEQTSYEQGKEELQIDLEKIQDLRYGENPHQIAGYYRFKGDISHTLANATQLQGKALSYNNILDTDAAWTAVREFADSSCVIVKHTNSCGGASDPDIAVAYQKAWQGDPISAFGGIIALNRPVTKAVVEAIFANKQFVEVLIAPSFEAEALSLLATKPNMRVLETGGVNPPGGRPALRSIEGGVLIQDEDTATEGSGSFTVAGKVAVDTDTMADLVFAWKVCKGIKSNAVVLAKDMQMHGMGAGQPNRVSSARLAVEQADRQFGEAAGCVAASDAFIPFPDTVEVLAAAGVKAIIQPGGSMRDAEVLEVAEAAGIAMIYTNKRHFRH
ncbi:MAG: bifunctional phosphoribosylaminoimidazolecarboxamide formyltransferase/IMP cyclohydrolase [Coriobacteriia bacterium]|nr:bifunctional phosphoribosylaminoimidazolecarboxamide formyltransferase/IMP cyclohydrolase [Coriobacteriia bacterium]